MISKNISDAELESRVFRRILVQNLALPLAMSFLLCVSFVVLLLSLLGTSREVAQANRVISKLNQTQRFVVEAETGLRGFLLNGVDEFLEPYSVAQDALGPSTGRLRELLINEADQLASLEKIITAHDKWNRLAISAIEARRRNVPFTLTDARARKRQMDDLRGHFDEVAVRAENMRAMQTSEANQRTQWALVLIVVLSLGAGSIIAWIGRRQLKLLSHNYQDALEQQRAQNEMLIQKSWIRSGQAELTTRLRGDQSGETVASAALDYLVKYTGGQVGTIYLAHGALELVKVAAHGLEQRVPERFRAGEGLVGQAFVSGQSLLITDIPSDAFRVTTSLAEITPRALAVIPLTADGITLAVLEIGFTSAPDARVMDLLREIAEPSGIALRSATYRLRLQSLLHESQQLTEELQTQQEELRVSNEELNERGRALQESQSRLESQHTELQQTIEQLEEQAQALDQRNVDLEQARDDVEEKAKELSAASRYKSEFLANMSHELRTPLNSSLILAKLLKDNPTDNLTAEQVEFAETIYSSGNDLLNLINDILDLSKVEAGKLDVRAESLEMYAVTQSLEKVFRPLAKDKGLAFMVVTEASAPETIVTDSLRLEQVLRNLLSNAVKFTPKGSVELRVSGDDAGRVVFSVKDSGIGIAVDQLDLIFEAFRQADGTSSRRYGGTGLGLSISRNLAHLLGGDLVAISEPGEGSVFTMTLPRIFQPAIKAEESAKFGEKSTPAPAPRPAAKAPNETRKRGEVSDDRDLQPVAGGRTLLIVEDDLPFAKILVELGRELGLRCLTVDNAEEGMEFAKRYVPSAIVLDMKLPDASGLSLLDRLKADPKTRHIPVQAVSAMDYSREALHLGAVGYRMKPLAREPLQEILKNLDNRSKQRVKRILLIEDDRVQRMSIEKLIGEKGVEITSVETAGEGLQRLSELAFDCVIVDLTLPDMSGYDLLQKMSAQKDSTKPPVIVYTGQSLSRDEEDRLSAYSRSIIIKGARSPERLLDEVTLFLHQEEAQLTTEQQRILQTSRNREHAFDGRRILVADDDVRNVFALTSALEQKGAVVIVARNGRQAVERVESDGKIDLVLMDIMMPEMDGYEAIRLIRSNPVHRALPIIAVTAKAMRDDFEKCLEVGANDYLAKPVDVDRLVSLMRVWLPKPFGRP